MEVDEWLRSRLEKIPLLRHMFARLNKEVIIETRTIKVRGILRNIDLSDKWFEVNAVEPNKKTYFIPWKYVVYLEAETYKGD